MLASTRSEEAYVREPQRVGVVDWLLKSDSRTRILDAVAHALDAPSCRLALAVGAVVVGFPLLIT